MSVKLYEKAIVLWTVRSALTVAHSLTHSLTVTHSLIVVVRFVAFVVGCEYSNAVNGVNEK